MLLACYIFPLYLNIMEKSYHHIVAVERFVQCIVLLEVVKNWNPLYLEVVQCFLPTRNVVDANASCTLLYLKVPSGQV